MLRKQRWNQASRTSPYPDCSRQTVEENGTFLFGLRKSLLSFLLPLLHYQHIMEGWWHAGHFVLLCNCTIGETRANGKSRWWSSRWGGGKIASRFVRKLTMVHCTEEATICVSVLCMCVCVCSNPDEKQNMFRYWNSFHPFVGGWLSDMFTGKEGDQPVLSLRVPIRKSFYPVMLSVRQRRVYETFGSCDLLTVPVRFVLRNEWNL